MQLEAATVGYVAASAPLLVVASLADSDDVDDTTVSFLCAPDSRAEGGGGEEGEDAEQGGGRGAVSGAVDAGAPLAVEDASRWPLAPVDEEDDGAPQAPRRSLFLIVRGALLRRFPRARAVRSWMSGHIPAPCLWQSLRCRRSTGMLGYFWEMTSSSRPSYLVFTCLLVLPVVCLARQWIHFYVSLQRLLGDTASGKSRCIQRLAWSVSGYTTMRQSTRHLEDFFCGMSTAPCFWQSFVRRCPCTPFFWDMTSGYAVFSSFLVRQWIHISVSLQWPGCFSCTPAWRWTSDPDRTCVTTCGRGAGTHGDVLNVHTGVFSVPHHTARTHHDHNDTHTRHNNNHHNITRRKEDRERRQRKRDKTREDETRQEGKRRDKMKKREKMKEKRRDKMKKKKREDERQEKRRQDQEERGDGRRKREERK